MKLYDVFGIGSALMDVLIHVDDADIEDLKLKKGNMHLVDDSHIDFIMSFLRHKKIKKQPGGSASNTVAGVVSLGGKAFFNGKVGKDNSGKEYEKFTLNQNINCDLKKDDTATGNVISLITKDSERTFATHLGSALNFTKDDVNKEMLLKSKILHIEGYMLENDLKKACMRALKIAKKNNITVSIDLSDPSLIERNLKDFRKIVNKYADILFLNEEEAKVFTGIEDEKQALIKTSESVKLAIVKLGEKGSIMKIRNKILRFSANTPEKLVDTTGAGDMYAAGILYGIASNLSLEESGQIASFAAAKIVSQTGARLEYGIKEY